MSQNKSVESSNHPSLNQSIHPALQAALGSLDLELEEELTRYRRQKAGRPVSRPSGLGRHQLRKPLELISLDKGEKSQTATRETNSDNQPLFPLVLIDQTDKATESQAQPEAEQTDQATDQINRIDQAPQEESNAEPFKPSQSSAEVGDDLVNPSAAEEPLDDYLESSERLLESLAEEEENNDAPEPLASKLLTPLGIGSMLLLLVLCASVPYILTNPSLMVALGLDRFLSPDKSTPEVSSIQTEVANIDDVVGNSSQMSGPNLAQKEFGSVNLNTLPLLETSPSPSPPDSSEDLLTDSLDLGAGDSLSNQEESSNPSLSGGSSNLSSVLLPPLPSPPSFDPRIEEPVSNSTESAPSEGEQAATSRQFKQSTSSVDTSRRENTELSDSKEQEQETANSSTAQSGYYFVLVNYTDESSLEKARQIVPDAYIRKLPQGTRIQMGAFQREADAKQLVERLQQEGISASISRD